MIEKEYYCYNGAELKLKAISEIVGIKYKTLRTRLGKLEWTEHEAFNIPVGQKRKKIK